MIVLKRALCLILLMLSAKGFCFELEKAVRRNNLTWANWILEIGRSPHTPLSDGLLPLEYAYEHHHKEMVELLRYFSKPLIRKEIRIEVAEVGDADAIARVYCEAWNDAYGDDAYKKIVDSEAVFWRNALLSPANHRKLLALKVEGRVVAFCDYIRAEDVMELKAFYVHPAFQGLGAGSTLINHLKTLFRKEGIGISLWVYEEHDDKVRPFFERHGFKLSDKSFKYCPDVGKTMIELVWDASDEINAPGKE